MCYPDHRTARALMEACLREASFSVYQPATGRLERWLTRQKILWLRRAGSQLAILGERLQASGQAESHLRHGDRLI